MHRHDQGPWEMKATDTTFTIFNSLTNEIVLEFGPNKNGEMCLSCTQDNQRVIRLAPTMLEYAKKYYRCQQWCESTSTDGEFSCDCLSLDEKDAMDRG